MLLGAISVVCVALAKGAGNEVRPAARSVRSWAELRYDGMERQKLDYSCGVAAIVNLLRPTQGKELNEQELLAEYFKSLPAEEQQLIIREGLSLYDLSVILQRLGYTPEGLRYDKTVVTRLRRPMIVYLVSQGCRHFAVLDGVWGNRAYLRDSSRGRIQLPLYKFFREWDGTALLVLELGEVEGGSPASVERGSLPVSAEAARRALR